MDKFEKLKEILPDIPRVHGNLKKEGATSLCGPCPKCGGVDRFVYKIDSRRFWCRRCNENGGDVIDFHAWVEGTDVKGLLEKYLPEQKSKKKPFKKTKPFEHYQLGFPVQKYPYVDLRGKILYFNCRFEFELEPKTFRQCGADGLSWTVKHIKKKVPYQLPKVVEAKTVFILNGEKACIRMNDIGQVGTCNVAGEGNWTSDLNQYFKGREVILVPDNDESGRKRIENVYSELKDFASSIKLLELPGLPEKGDFVDWLDMVGDIDFAAEQLAIMVENAGPYEPKETETVNFPDPKPESKSDLISAVSAIIDLDPLTRERERNRISKEHNVRKSIIDGFIKESIKAKSIGGEKEIVTEVEPAENSIDGPDLLLTIKNILKKHVLLPGGVAEPIAAWVVLTYCYGAFRILPMLGVVSPVKRCGKTTLLEVLQGLTNKGLTASNISPAAIFRTIEKYSPTLLVDEADTFLKDNDELRGVLNSGHTRAGAFVVRVEGESHEPVKFSTWGPKAVAMIGNLPDTLQDRSVEVSLRRKAPGETVSRIDIDFENECSGLRQACKRWADDHLNRLKTIKTDIPKTNNDRMSDNWAPLLAIADIAGGDWPDLMRKSMFGMLNGTDDSIGPKLLKDIQDIFKSRTGERVFSEDLVEALKDKKESPWVDWHRGKGLTQNGLARLLKPFGVHSKTMRIAEDRKKGYEFDGFKDAFKRYIPSLSPITPISSVTPGQTNNNNGLDANQTVTGKNDVTDKKQDNQLNLFDCHTVTDEKGGMVKGKEKTDLPVWKRLNFKSEQAYIDMIS